MGLYKMIEQKKKEQKRKEKAKMVKKIGVTAVVGTTLGVVAGVLFAPKSGKETREDLAEKTVKAKDELIDKSKILKENMNTKLSEVNQDISVAKEKIQAYLVSKKNSEVVQEDEQVSEIKEVNENDIIE